MTASPLHAPSTIILWAACRADAEGFSMQQFVVSAPSSKALPCVAKLIGLETSGNICARGCVFYRASACLCVCVYMVDVLRLLTF